MELIYQLNDIQEAAKTLIELAGNRRVFALNGEMGAGKTTFVHAVADFLGVKDVVSSPTFSIINEYRTANNATVFHMDWYRLKGEEEALQAGVEDSLYSGAYCFVEWPQMASSLLPTDTIWLDIKTINADTRKLLINL